jgi:hypothetical protein
LSTLAKPQQICGSEGSENAKVLTKNEVLRSPPPEGAKTAKFPDATTGSVDTADCPDRRPKQDRVSRCHVEAEEPSRSWVEAQEERAAIGEHDRKIAWDWAEGFARLDPDRPPKDVPLKRWQQFVDDAGRLIDSGHVAEADSGGMGRPRPIRPRRGETIGRVDQMGLAWFIKGGRVVKHVDECRGDRGANWCSADLPAQGGASGRVLVWELFNEKELR